MFLPLVIQQYNPSVKSGKKRIKESQGEADLGEKEGEGVLMYVFSQLVKSPF